MRFGQWQMMLMQCDERTPRKDSESSSIDIVGNFDLTIVAEQRFISIENKAQMIDDDPSHQLVFFFFLLSDRII